MTILQALERHHKRLVSNGEAPSYGFSREPISYVIVMSIQGTLVDVVPLLVTSGRRPGPTVHQVPQPVNRTSGIAANFLWDNTSYVLGVARNPATKQAITTEIKHAAFKKFNMDLLAESDDGALRALCRFLEQWQISAYGSLGGVEEILGANVVFRLDGERSFIHERSAAKTIWTNHLAHQRGAEGLCLVTGSRGPLARVHPVVKGVRGAQPSGARVVSFNLDAFESFGKRQGANAPISQQAAFAYTTALNTLLARDSRRRVQIADTTTVYWAEATCGEDAAAAAELLFAMLIRPNMSADEDEATIADKLEAFRAGGPLADIVAGVEEETSFHVLGLSPNAARLSIRFWHAESIGAIARRVAEHWRDLRIQPLPWKTPPAAWRLLVETAFQRKIENIPPVLGGALMRSILTGSPYPRTLLAAIVMRIRHDGQVNGMRAAICKAFIARTHRLGLDTEDVPVTLNANEPNVAYRLGRLFAVYERVQIAALGKVNATIRNRYLGAASAAPATNFLLLERISGHHLALLRKSGKPQLAHWFEQEIDEILAGVDTLLPRSLRLEDQGRFVIGYHHQRVTNRRVAAGQRP